MSAKLNENNEDRNEDRDNRPIELHFRNEHEQMIPLRTKEELYRIDEKETECGWWLFRGSKFERFANKKVFVIFFGITGCLVSATFSYFNATITSIEKRFKIPSQNSGFISTSSEISVLFVSIFLGYYAGKGHKPRWMAFGLLTVFLFCFLNFLPHLLYGPGEDSLALTQEYGEKNESLIFDYDEKKKKICRTTDLKNVECQKDEDSPYVPQFIFLSAQLISGVGQGLLQILGTTYMDDNVKKSETASFISLQFFFRLLGPAVGYSLGSLFLMLYISPTSTPTINNVDTRWVGAWWIGWIFFAILMLILAIITGMFPRTMPDTILWKTENQGIRETYTDITEIKEEKPSLKDMFITYKRILLNKIMLFNNLAGMFYIFGGMPMYIFAPKYIETQYRQSAAVANLVTGNVSIIFQAIGILISGLVITKFKPSARYMGAWNFIIGIVHLFGTISLIWLGCEDVDKSTIVNKYPSLSSNSSLVCNYDCHCDLVKYSPICGEDGTTYISACHAGCKTLVMEKDKEAYYDCSCITPTNFSFAPVTPSSISNFVTLLNNDQQKYYSGGGSAKSGACDANCYTQFVIFLTISSICNFFGSTGRTTNFLLYLRCIDDKDKVAALAFGTLFLCLTAFIPSPIAGGYLLDKTCILWGSTCGTGSGNCWIYDGEKLRLWLNSYTAFFILFGIICDGCVWYYVKGMNVYQEGSAMKNIDKNLLRQNSENRRISLSR